MKKSYLSGCVILGLVFSTLVGCGDDDDSTNGSAGGHGGAVARGGGGGGTARGGGGGGTARGGGGGGGNGGAIGVAGASGSAGLSGVTGGRNGGGGITGAGGTTGTGARGGTTGTGARGGTTGTGARGGTTGSAGEAGSLAGGGAGGSGEAGQNGNAGAGGAESAQVQSLSDAQIFLVLEDLNAGEVQQANAALPKLTVTDVSAFAQAMIADHTQARGEVQALAQSLTVTPIESAVDAKLRWKSAVVVDTLTAGTSPLDAAYIRSQVKAHADALKLLDGLEPDAPELVQLISTLRTAVQAHYDVAVTIRASL